MYVVEGMKGYTWMTVFYNIISYFEIVHRVGENFMGFKTNRNSNTLINLVRTILKTNNNSALNKKLSPLSSL